MSMFGGWIGARYVSASNRLWTGAGEACVGSVGAGTARAAAVPLPCQAAILVLNSESLARPTVARARAKTLITAVECLVMTNRGRLGRTARSRPTSTQHTGAEGRLCGLYRLFRS